MRTLRTLLFTILFLLAVGGLWKATEVWGPEPARSTAVRVERSTTTQLIGWWETWRPAWASE